ncbi:MAG TPA: hypothetical protein VIV60_02450, partial [Polyangiaceae bacterium]
RDSNHVEALGEVSLSLLTSDHGKTFRLHGTFVVRDGFDSDSPPVTTLSSETDPNAETLSAPLPAGIYTIWLQPGWRLEVQADDGTWRLTNADVSGGLDWGPLVQIYPGRVTTASFQFSVNNAVDEQQGTLTIGIGVAQPPLCGNHVVDPNEVCDEGIYNGQYGRCDAACRFVCAGACPLRVVPGVGYPVGNGLSWNAPLPDLQSAIDQQSALGGGQVWVANGDFTLPSDPGTPIILRSNVSIYGGFQTSENSPGERDPNSPLTTLRDPRSVPATYSAPAVVLESIGQQNIVVDNLYVITANPAIHLEGGGQILFRNVTVEGNGFAIHSDVLRTEVRFENGHFMTGWSIQDSRAAFVDTLVTEGLYGSFRANNSRLLLDRVDTQLPLSLENGSQGLIKETTLRGRFDRGGVLYVASAADSDTPASMATLMDSQVLIGGAQTPLLGGSLFVWNSSFVNMHSAGAGGVHAAAAAIESDDLELAASTFFNNTCSEGPFGHCWEDVTTSETSIIHNTLFVQADLPFIGPPERQIRPSPIEGNPRTLGICISTARDQFQVDASQVLAVSHPCLNGGDAAELEASRQRLLTRIAPFITPPFNADVSRYQSADWWRQETVLAGQCTDEDAPDPGRHYPIGCSAPNL